MKKLVLGFLLSLSALGWASAQSANVQAQTSQQFPHWLAVRVLQAAHDDLQPYTGLNLGQTIQAYRNGAVVIEYVCRDLVDPCKGVYQIIAGGGLVVVSITDSF